jgi:hypothetical protein
MLVSVVGVLRIERGYYHCPHCRKGHCPIDIVFGLNSSELTPGSTELVCLAAARESFAKASEITLKRLSGLNVAESTVERTAEAVGAEVGQAIESKVPFDEARPWAWHKDADGKTCAYVSIDLTGVRKQGPKGATAEGEMIAVGMVYNPIPKDRDRWAAPSRRRPPWQARYVASAEGQKAVAEPLRHMAARAGMSEAQRWIAVCDGGAGLEDLLRTHFGRIDEVILDFYHASEHLGDLAKAWHADEAKAKETHAEWSHRLKHEGGTAILAWLESLDLTATPRARTTWEATKTYFRNQHHRMDYPTYLAKGWQIGSGPMEAGCKLVINERMNGTGMRWGHEGADAMAHLRALYISESTLWTSYWANRRKSA